MQGNNIGMGLPIINDDDKINRWLESSIESSEVECAIDTRGIDETFVDHANLVCCRQAVRDQRKAVDDKPMAQHSQPEKTHHDHGRAHSETRSKKQPRSQMASGNRELMEDDSSDGESCISKLTCKSGRSAVIHRGVTMGKQFGNPSEHDGK